MQVEEQRKQILDEEEMMLKMVIEASLKEEQERAKRLEEVQNEEEQILTMVKQKSIQEAEEAKKAEVVQQPDAVQQRVKLPEKVVTEEEVPNDSKYEEVKEEPKQMKAKKDPLPGFTSYNLPPLSMKKGGAFDNDILRQQHEAIQKGLQSMDNELEAFNDP